MEHSENIEITDAMIEAGIAAIYPYDEELLSPQERVRLIVAAALRAMATHG